MKLGLVYAMRSEVESLLKLMDGKLLELVSGVSIYSLGENIIAAAGGVGKVNAAMATQLLIDRYAPELIFNAGIAGTLEDIKPYTLLLPTSFIQHDVDTTAVGDPIGFVSTVEKVEFPCAYVEESRAILDELGFKYSVGRVASGDWFAVNGERARFIHKTFCPTLVDMEGCAVAQVAYRARIPFIALKCVSDRILHEGGANGEEYLFNLDIACRSLAECSAAFIKAWAAREKTKKTHKNQLTST